MGLYFAMLYFVMVRFGLFAAIIMVIVVVSLGQAPITTDPANWYAANGYFVMALIAALAVIGFRISLGSRKVFAEEER